MAGSLTISTLNNDTGVLATQNGMTGIPKAWCQFSMSGTTITINGSFNISSITYNASGYYTANITTAMPNINYSVVGPGCVNQSASNFTFFVAFAQSGSPFFVAPTTTSFGFGYIQPGTGGVNPVYGNFAVFSS